MSGIGIEGTINLVDIINKLSKKEQLELGKKILDLINEVTRSNDKQL